MAAQRHILTTQSYAYIIVNAIDLQWQLFVCRSLFTLCVSDVLLYCLHPHNVTPRFQFTHFAIKENRHFLR